MNSKMVLLFLTLFLNYYYLFSIPPHITGKIQPPIVEPEYLEDPELMRVPGLSRAPVIGNKKVAVIVVDFNEVSFSPGWQQALNDSFAKFKNYYIEVSNNRFIPEVTFFYSNGSSSSLPSNAIAYRAPRSITYYAQNTGASITQLLKDALYLAGGKVSRPPYDYLVVIHAGYGAESMSDPTGHIWSMKVSWSGAVYGFTSGATVPEKEYNGSNVGVICHEFGHVLGLPDLYSYQTGSVVGRWCLMDSGSWAGSPRGSSPTHLSAWCKKFLGWVDVHIVSVTVMGYELEEVKRPNNRVLQLPILEATNPQREYFLLEYRKREKFDTYLRGEGVLIWRINDNVSGNSGSQLGVDLIEADKTPASNGGDSGDPFPGSKRVYYFIPSSWNVLASNGREIKMSITNITTTYTVAYFNIIYGSGGTTVYYTLNVSVSPVGAGTVSLSPAGGVYVAGTQVKLTAVANSGYVFSHWSGSISGSSNPVTIVMNSNKSVTANFVEASPLHVFEDFERYSSSNDLVWYSYADTQPTDSSPGKSTCSIRLATDVKYRGEKSLRVSYTIVNEPPNKWGWAGVGRSFNKVQDWSSVNRIEFWVNPLSTQTIALSIGVEDPTQTDPSFQNPVPHTPFEKIVDLTSTGWQKVVINFSELRRPSWLSSGRDSFDPKKVVNINFVPYVSVNSFSGVFYIDDILGPPPPQEDTTTYYILNVSVLPSNSGRVELMPLSSDGRYVAGTTVTLRAVANSGYTFSHWSGSVSGTMNPISFVMDSDKSITANFKLQGTTIYYTLSVNVNPQGGGVVQVSPSSADGRYVAGTTVTLTAVAYSGYIFSGWSGDLSGIQNPMHLIMNSDKNITANFVKASYRLIITIDPPEGGEVIVTPELDEFLFGSTVTLYADAYENYEFLGWGGDIESENNPLELVITTNTKIVASFGYKVSKFYKLNIKVLPSNGGKVKIEPELDSYIVGSKVILTAEAYKGYRFLNWSGGISSSENPIEIIITTNTLVIANFYRTFVGNKIVLTPNNDLSNEIFEGSDDNINRIKVFSPKQKVILNLSREEKTKVRDLPVGLYIFEIEYNDGNKERGSLIVVK